MSPLDRSPRPVRGSRPARAALLAALVLAGGGCRSRPPEPPPIVVISIDTLRSDRLPAYGYSRGSTPAIDRLAREGVLFEQAFAQAPQTLPSHASLLTGLLPPAHGVHDNVGTALGVDAGRTLAERLAAAGYATGGAVSTLVLRAATGIGRGFERFDAPAEAARPAATTLATLLPWLEEWRARRFLVLFHLFEPHSPYEPPAEIARRIPDPYDGEIAAADRSVGNLLASLDRLGLYDRALIVLLSDHGEGLGDHGEEEHGLLLYRESIQVPLIVKLPGQARAGERVARTVALIDLVPTLIAIAGLDPDPALPGRSLLATHALAPRPVYSETWSTYIQFGWSELLSAIDGRYHYIEAPEPELYDLLADPGETRNLVADERRVGAALRAFLAPFPREIATPEPTADAETAARLSALGYLSGAGAADRSGPRLNPVDELPKLAPVLRGIREFNEGRPGAAVALLEPALAANPGAAHGWQYLGRALAALGRHDEARAAFARIAGAAPREDPRAVPDALRLIGLGRAEEALERVRRDLARVPGSADLRTVESRALLVLGRAEAAVDDGRSDGAGGAHLAAATGLRCHFACPRRWGNAPSTCSTRAWPRPMTR